MGFEEVRARWQRFRERAADRREAKRRAMQADQHHGRFWLLNVPATATLCAAIVEVYWAMLFCIEATGHLGVDWATSSASDAQATGTWHFLFDIQNAPVLIGLICATIPIVMLSMVWLPVQFAMRGAGVWRRGTIIAVGVLANVLVIVSGTVVMNYNRQDQVREALVVEQTADANRTMLTASVQDLRDELATLMNHRSTYVATAASVGAAAFERDYVAQARATNDPRLPLIERAMGAARRADELREQIRGARQTVAAASPAASTQANVQDNVGRELNTFAQYVEVWRPPFVAFICTLIGIFGAWWTLAMLERLNPHDVIRSGWADEGHRIEDLRDEPAVQPERDASGKVKMKPPRRKFTEADTGEEIEQTLVPEHYRTIKRNKPVQMPITPEVPPDETGVPRERDGRDAELYAASMHQPVDPIPEHVPADGAGATAAVEERAVEELGPVVQETPESPQDQPSEETVADLNALVLDDGSFDANDGNAPVAEETAPQHDEDDAADDGAQHDQNEQPAQDEIPQREEPETDPARMIAAE